MATKKKPRASAEPAAVTDPTAPVDSPMLLKAAQPVLKLLEADLTARAKASPAVTLALTARHQQERDARRTADAFPQWLEHFVEQVAAAWLLSCVFVRTLEDRGLLGQNRIAGPGALDSQRVFLELAPSLSERDYLLFVFRELTRLPAAKALFDARHNPVWMLAPSAEAAKALLQLFRSPSADTPSLRFGQADTRVLGDLYQDLNANVRKRFALLQTPGFVEAFILDRTLEPAIQKFGLEATDLIDPTCGSGHFLLGAFERLYDHQLREQPGLSPREAARLALDKVYGADINPYAVAVARFRLTLAYLEKAGFQKLGDAPELPLHVVVADSLLHNPQLKLDAPGTIDRAVQTSFLDMAQLDSEARVGFGGREFQLEDPEAAREVLTRKYAAVVGNPPYITVKDSVLRDRYREMYRSAHREFSLGVPFTERFFHLGRAGARVGMITANSFMKREFGKKLIEAFLPTVNLDLIVNTSGAYIPGHGTPTVLLFGSAEEAQVSDVLTVLAKRGEPTTPTDPAQGLVWQSIVSHFSEHGFENDYVSVAAAPRLSLAAHPWSLAGGGAGEVKERLEAATDTVLSDKVDSIGFMCITKQDDVFSLPVGTLARAGVDAAPWVRHFVIGQHVRDWSIESDQEVFFPYTEAGELRPLHDTDSAYRRLWTHRVILGDRAVFGGKTFREVGRAWHAFGQIPADRIAGPCITFAEVATHNHFALDQGGRVFKQTAPIIKLSASATDDDHHSLLAYLNSSTACFWMKQVCHNKTNASQKHSTDPARAAHQFAGTAMQPMPVFEPPGVATAARRLSQLAADRGTWADGSQFRQCASEALRTTTSLQRFVEAGWKEFERLTRRMVYLQEEIDWAVYEAAGLVCHGAAGVRLEADIEADLGTRPFERTAGYDDGVSARARRSAVSPTAVGESPEHWNARHSLLEKDEIQTIEARAYKRMWRETEQNIDAQDYRDGVVKGWLRRFIADSFEACFATVSVQTPRALFAALDLDVLETVGSALGEDPAGLVQSIAAGESVPFLDAYVYTPSGLAKRELWRTTWALQRAEDRGETLGTIEVPPTYAQGSRGKSTDFRDGRYWSLRGKLDVPKERFIAYPDCESDEDGEPVYGWAGWDHLQRAQALVGLYNDRKGREGWERERLVPMLAGLLELIPWLKQWHNEASAEFDGLRMGDSYEAFLDGECRGLGVTREVLVGWRPGKDKGTKSKAASDERITANDPEAM